LVSETLRKKAALLVSAALNAPFLALVSFVPLILTTWSSISPLLIFITTVFGCVLPLAIIFYLAKKRIIPDIYASDRKTRGKPILIAMTSYVVGVLALLVVRAPPTITAFMASYVGNSLVILFISLVWKISIHASGVAGPITALVFKLGAWMLPLFLLIIPVAWARVELKAHDYKQVAAGVFLAAGLTWIQMNFYLNSLLVI